MSKEKAIELIKDSLLEIPDIDADRGYPALMRVKKNLNEMLKELEDWIMDIKNLKKIMPILQAIVDGKTIT